jgi:hypothetical protein
MCRATNIFLSFVISLVLAFGGAAQDNRDRGRDREPKPDKKPVVIEEKPKNDRDKGGKDRDRGSGDRKKPY